MDPTFCLLPEQFVTSFESSSKWASFLLSWGFFFVCIEYLFPFQCQSFDQARREITSLLSLSPGLFLGERGCGGDECIEELMVSTHKAFYLFLG